MQIAEGLQTHRKLTGPIQKEEEGGGLGEGMTVPDHLRLAFIRATLQAHNQEKSDLKSKKLILLK